MHENRGISCPEGSLVVTQVGEREWMFEYPRLEWETLEVLHTAIDEWHMGDVGSAEDRYRQLVGDYPEFIDAHHHLALLLGETGRGEEAFQLWQDVVELGLDCLPGEFEMGRDSLSWLILENRPFLRAYHALGLEYLGRGEVERALEIFNNMLAMNPGDNQGVRALVVDCNFRLDRPADVLAVCDRYPDDGMEQLMYGRALALYQLGRKAEAEEALNQAIEFLPLVAKELAKILHTRPREVRPGYITHGGADQAYYYRAEQGQHWENTPGAIEFVRDRQEGQDQDPEMVRQAQDLPLRRDMLTLLTYVRDNKVVGTQSTGNMPLRAVREVTARFANPPQLDTTIGDHIYRLRALPVNTRIPFEEFADGLIEQTGLAWSAPDSDFAATALRGSIGRMVIHVLARFGAVDREYRDEPLGKGTLSRLVAFEITPFGKALLDAVAMVDE